MADVRCSVDLILGTGTISVRQCLALDVQSLVTLDQPAGSDLELRVYGVGIAHGEVVVVDENTALRVTRIDPPPGAEGS